METCTSAAVVHVCHTLYPSLRLGVILVITFVVADMKMAHCAATIQVWQLLEGGVCLKIYGILKWYIYNISGGRCSSVTVHVYTSLSDWSLPEFDVTV